MYKLFITRVTNRISSDGTFFVPKQIIVQRSMRLCSFCNFYHWKTSKFVIHHQVRTNVTTINMLGHFPIKNKNKQETKKYAELLEVTDQMTTTRRTAVERVKASNISLLFDQSSLVTNKSNVIKDFTSDKIYHSEHISKDSHTSYQDNSSLNIENNMDTLSSTETEFYNNSFNENETLVDLNEYLNTDNVVHDYKTISDDTYVKGKKDSILANKKRNKTEKSKEWKKKEESYDPITVKLHIENLLAHMQTYLSCGLLSKARRMLMRHRKYIKNTLQYSNEHIKLYNTLLDNYASRGDIVNGLLLYTIIKDDSLTPTPQTYAYILDALGRGKTTENKIGFLKKLQLEMHQNNISFNDIFEKSYFKNDQRENILRVVKLLIPNFEATYTVENTENTCKLLNKVRLKNNYESPVQGLLTIDELKEFFKTQYENEMAFEVKIQSIYKNETKYKKSNSKCRQKIILVENYWRQIALAAFERDLKYLKEKENQSGALFVLHPFLEVLDKKHYIDAILREIKQIGQNFDNYSACLKFLYIEVGKYIYKRYEVQMEQQTGALNMLVNIYEKYLEWYLHPKRMVQFSNMNNRTAWAHLEKKEESQGASIKKMCIPWPTDVVINIGKFLYKIILNDIRLHPDVLKGHECKSSIPAFYTLYRYKGNHLVEQIKPHPLVSNLYKELQLEVLTFDSVLIPSFSPPRPWTSIFTGGYFITGTNFIRTQNFGIQWQKLQTTPPNQLFSVLDSLNQLSSVPWIINTTILDIVLKIFKAGGSVELHVPQSISALPRPAPIDKNATPTEKRIAAKAIAKYRQKRNETYSIWCDTLYKLSLANHFRNKIFWLPHNMDFRGRVYPVPPHLSHLSSDLSRSLLLFANGKPLGPKGLDWLKLHVINLTNFKKGCSVKECLEYANENIENILDSAIKPLTGKMWWSKSEEPWQTLAGCIEIANALKSPNVEEYKSHFPVHQDGSCNGLQHYAALGRDQIGAESVNLYPHDTPKDVYTAIVDIVEKQRQIDAKNNVEVAKILDGFIKRKVIKQTVMTTVYGVTKYGAKLQVSKQLKDIPQFPEEYIGSASAYIVEKTFQSLSTMFTSARQIQEWFTLCARSISTTFNENVEWITPLGLPVVQPYIKQKFSEISIKGTGKPDALKQKNAFAPNFIHSLDSTHMMLTSLHCKEVDVTFVSVHDCFWTHACTVDIMNKICREQFVSLHSEPILEDLFKFFNERYKITPEKLQNQKQLADTTKNIHKYFSSVPNKGTFDINNVLKSTYFFG